MTDQPRELAPTQFHPSFFENYRYVYPALSRRASGVSIGVNLSPTKRCNFRCVYCQVAREESASAVARALDTPTRDEDVLSRPCDARSSAIDLDALRDEALSLARATLDGTIFQRERFARAPAERRVLRDFALSGDGEPTLSPLFGGAVDVLVQARRDLRYEPLKLVLITNATRLNVPSVAAAIDRLASANGEIWTKLDALTPERLRAINRTRVPLETILDNIRTASKRWPIKAQRALLSWGDVALARRDDELFCDFLNATRAEGGAIQSVQLYTVARVPTERNALPLADSEMDERAEFVRRRTGLPVETYYSK